MPIISRLTASAAMTGIFLAAPVMGEAHAGPSSDGQSNVRGWSLFQISNNGDSILEIDRTLNFNQGDGSSGTDNDND